MLKIFKTLALCSYFFFKLKEYLSVYKELEYKFKNIILIKVEILKIKNMLN